MTDNYRVERVGGVEYRYDAEWTKRLEAKQHWEFYWYQQRLMDGLVTPKQDRILELGKGSGFAANYCRSKGLDVTSLDIDEEKRPDIVANLVTYDFSDCYDHVMAFEILEHIPYEHFERVIRKVPDFVGKYAFISLPRNEQVAFGFSLKVPKIRPFSFEWRILRNQITCATHHWELDYGVYSTRRIEDLFRECGLRVVRTLSCDYIRFYALEVAHTENSP